MAIPSLKQSSATLRKSCKSSRAPSTRVAPPPQTWLDCLYQEGTSENNRKAKFYKLTSNGRKQLQKFETTKWNKLTRAIARILSVRFGHAR